MKKQISLGENTIHVVFKDIENIHLSVHPPAGRITVSAPTRLSLERIRLFAISKLGWIKRQQQKLTNQTRETPREYLDRESHFVWGQRYLLEVVKGAKSTEVDLKPGRLVLRLRQDVPAGVKEATIAAWYREQIRNAAPEIIKKWAPLLGVSAEKFYVQHMKTKWGSCNPEARSIRLNTELAKKPKDCFEYVIVHELAHLIEPTHNARFIAIMDRAMPNWRIRRDQLNDLPVAHEEWKS